MVCKTRNELCDSTPCHIPSFVLSPTSQKSAAKKLFANDFPNDMMYVTKVKDFTYLSLLNGHSLSTDYLVRFMKRWWFG